MGILQQLGSKIPGMNRPKGLNVSALAMALCNVMLWTVLNPATRPHYLRVLASWTVVIGIGFVVIWFYWQGKNWARIAVLIYSALCIWNLSGWSRFSSSPGFLTTPIQISLVSRALLGVVLLFWLNTRPVREFFLSKSQLPLAAAKERDFEIVVVLVFLLAGVVVSSRDTLLPRVTGHVVVLSDAAACHGNSSDKVGCITPPRQTYAPQPSYPKKDWKANHEDVLTLLLAVRTDGTPSDISVLSSPGEEFDRAAIDAVKQWKFAPATQDGKPIAVKIAVEISFHR
jgi:TonB family protein